MKRFFYHKKGIWGSVVVLISFIAFITFTGYYFFDLNRDINETVEGIYTPLERGDTSSKREEPISLEESLSPISILLLGVDNRSGLQGRSDTMVIMTLNPKQENMYLLSIPRDTKTEIIGRGAEDKINHAYAFGGVEMTIATVELFLDIPIDYFVQVDLEGFVHIIDILDGVTIDVQQGFDYEGYVFHEGDMHMDGELALAYSRMRKLDPDGDIGRNTRQQQIIKAILGKAISYQSLTKIEPLLDEISRNVRTNLKREDIDQLRKEYISATKEQKTLTFQGESRRVDGIFYYIIEEEEKLRVSQMVKKHLNVEERIGGE